MTIGTQLKAGALRRKIRTGSQEDRLRLLVVRAGLKAGTMRLTGLRCARNRV